MRILSRYVFRAFCVPLTYCLLGFIAIYVLFELFGSFSRLSSAKPPLGVVIEYFAAYLAPQFQWLAPACLMLATLYTMWNFCRHSELIAMRASGIGFFAIVKPLLIAACLMAAFVAWVNECYVPARSQWAERYRNARFKGDEMKGDQKLLYKVPLARRTWEAGSIMAADASALEDVTVIVTGEKPGDPDMTIVAPRVEYLDGQWFFYEPVIRRMTSKGVPVPSPTPELEKLSIRAFPEFTETPADFMQEKRDVKQYGSTRERMRYLETHPNLSDDVRYTYEYALWSKLAAPLACLVITLFAIPAGVATGRQSVFKGIVGALALFFVFYGVTIGCMALAYRGWLWSPVAAFLPDVVFFAIGCMLFWRQR